MQSPLSAKLQATAQTRPNHPALIVGESTLNYADFTMAVNDRANALNTPYIAWPLTRTADDYITLAACLITHTCFVPINPSYPPALQRQMIKQVDTAFSTRPEITTLDLAAIFHTSGTTGEPKGVMITHSNVTAFLSAMQSRFDITATDRISQFAHLSFDIALFDCAMAWLTGATLCVVPLASQLLPYQFIQQQRISVWFSVPSIIHFMDNCKLLKPAVFPDLRISIFAGETLSVDAAKAWHIAAPHSRIDNFYGPVETTIDCIAHQLTKGDFYHNEIPIGKPLGDTKIKLVNDELLITGSFTGPGYLDKAVSAEKFIDGWYHTGDCVHQDTNGLLYFRGRKDHQVKINGHRVELLAVEKIIRETSGCHEVMAFILNKQGRDELCVAIVAEQLDIAALRKQLQQTTPTHMIPSRIQCIDALPYTIHGKVDRGSVINPYANR